MNRYFFRGSNSAFFIFASLSKCDQFFKGKGQILSYKSRLFWKNCVIQDSLKEVIIYSLKCLSIGTPKTINFPFVSNGKLTDFSCLNIQAHYNEAVIYRTFGTLKDDEFSIWNK